MWLGRKILVTGLPPLADLNKDIVIFLNMYIAAICDTPAWGENLDSIKLRSITAFNKIRNMKLLLFLWFKLLFIGINFPCPENETLKGGG